MSYYSLFTALNGLNQWNQRGIKNFSILGSNDGSTWSLVDSQTVSNPGAETSQVFIVKNPQNPYSYYRLIVHSVFGTDGNGVLQLGSWELNTITKLPYYLINNDIPISTKYSIFIVAKQKIPQTSVDYNYIMTNIESDNLLIGTGGPNNYFTTSIGVKDKFSDAVNTPNNTLSKTSLLTVINNGNTLTPYFNSVALNNKSGVNKSFTGLKIMDNNHDLSEIIIYNRDLTTSEKQQVENYLIKKWNIESNVTLPELPVLIKSKIDMDGNFMFVDNKALLNKDGTATFCDNKITIDKDGQILTKGEKAMPSGYSGVKIEDINCSNSINIGSSANNDSIKILSDGSASFANGKITIDVNGNLNINGFLLQDVGDAFHIKSTGGNILRVQTNSDIGFGGRGLASMIFTGKGIRLQSYKNGGFLSYNGYEDTLAFNNRNIQVHYFA